MSQALALAFALAMISAPSPLQDPIPPTPSAADVPAPVPGDIGLAGEERPDDTRFLHARSASAPSLSPDGERLAFRTSITGVPQLWVVDAQGGWPEQLTFGEGTTLHAWSPDGEWILYASDRGGDEREGYYLISPDGTRERQLLAPADAYRPLSGGTAVRCSGRRWAAPSAQRVFGGFSPDGARIAYATTERNGRDFDVHVLELASGADRCVFTGSFGFFPVSWQPDGAALLVSETRGEDANDIHMLDLASGAMEVLLRPEVAASYSGFAWKPDGSGFFLTSDEGRDFRGLAWYDLAERRLSFVEEPLADVDDLAATRDGRFLLWTTNQGGFSVLHARDLARSLDLALPDEPSLPLGVYHLSTAPGAPVAALACVGPQVPGDVWTLDLCAMRLARATRSSSAGLDLARLVVPEHLDFPARDGVVLHGLLYLPPVLRPKEKPPVLIAVHGGPTAQARPAFNPVHQYLVTRRIAVFDLNFRGSTGYGKAFARLDDRRLRPNAVRDVEDALDWLARDGRVDAQRAAVMGGSYGGFLTNAALTTFPERFRCGVSLVGVSNWITALEGASPALRASDRSEYGDIDDPGDREFFRELSPLTHVERIQAPLCVVHGANDPRDPVGESDQFVRAIREQRGAVEYLRFPDEGHGVRKLANRVTAYRRIAAFLEKHLAPRP